MTALPVPFNFATSAGWQYFRNTWITATLAAAALGASCSLVRPAHAGDAPMHGPVLVEIVSIDPGGDVHNVIPIIGAPDVATCTAIALSEMEAHEDQVKDILSGGLSIKVYCLDTRSGQVFALRSSATKDEKTHPKGVDDEQLQLPRTGI